MASLMVASCAGSCDSAEKRRLKATTELTYDQKTGKLTRITADLNKNGRIDSWTYMDGTVPLYTEEDRDENGKLDHWEYVAPDGKVLRTAISRRNSGKPDTWITAEPGTRLVRMQFSPTNDEKKITRWELYDVDRLIAVEEDTNGDGVPDKWERNDGEAILAVEFDVNFDGVRDRRMVFGPGGSVVSIETEPDGRGGYKKKVEPRG